MPMQHPRIQSKAHAVPQHTQAVADHHATSGLLDRLLDTLRTAGKDIAQLTIDNLAPVDEMQSRRRAATEAPTRMPSPEGLTERDRHGRWAGRAHDLAPVAPG